MRIELQEYGAPVVRKVDELNLRALAEANIRWKKALGLSSDPIRVEEIGNGDFAITLPEGNPIGEEIKNMFNDMKTQRIADTFGWIVPVESYATQPR
jgi:hypothetical protein